MTTMKAYRLLDWERPPELVDIEVPEPPPGYVRVRVAGNGLCHSDVTMMQMPASIGEMLGWQMPFTLGHEAGGRIDAVGDGVDGFAAGDPVALMSANSCGICTYCERGLDSACPNGLAGRGYGRDGGLAEFVLARAPRDLIPLDSLDPVAAGPLTDAGATSYHGVRRVRAKLGPGSTVVVIGAGGLGAYTVQILRAVCPARVIAIDTNPARLDYARELGAHETLAGVAGSTAAEIRELTGGDGADAVLDIVGVDATIAAGLAALRPAGSFVLVGAGGGTFAQPWFGGLPREAEIVTFQGSTVADVHAVIELAERGHIRNDVDVFSFGDVTRAYEELAAGTLRGRAVVTPN